MGSTNFSFGNLNSTKVSVGATTTAVISTVDANRAYLALVNDSDEDIYIGLGAAAVLNEGIRLNSGGGSLEFIRGTGMFTGLVNAISASGTKNLTIVVSNV